MQVPVWQFLQSNQPGMPPMTLMLEPNSVGKPDTKIQYTLRADCRSPPFLLDPRNMCTTATNARTHTGLTGTGYFGDMSGYMASNFQSGPVPCMYLPTQHACQLAQAYNQNAIMDSAKRKLPMEFCNQTDGVESCRALSDESASSRKVSSNVASL